MKKLNLNENFISRIWRDKMHYTGLKTTTGKTVEILDYGTVNKDSGADYKNARIKIDNDIFIGDIEIHRSLKDWNLHKHKKSGKYNKVVLQVVFWEDDFDEGSDVPKVLKSREIPTVILSNFLTKSIHEIWKEIINNPSVDFKIPCFPENKKINTEVKNEWIYKLSLKRIKYRTSRLQQRLDRLEEINETGGKKQLWEKLFFEYTLEALGFSKNKENFLKFAGDVNFDKIKKYNLNIVELESLFFGSAGLLDNIKFREEYVDRLKENWKQLKAIFKPPVMNKSEWNFFRLRPQNFPTIRMAYAASFCKELIFNDFFKRIILCFEKSKNIGKDVKNLFLDIQLSGYWKNHYIFGRETGSQIKSIGEDRVKEIIVNVVLPLLYLYAEKFGKKDLSEKVLDYYLNTKDKSENEITRIMQKQLFFKGITISQTQGLIHLHNFYCVKVKCSDCEIGNEVIGKENIPDIFRIILY